MGGFAFSSLFGTPYYEGGGTIDLPPGIFDVALGGHPYMIDWKSEIPLRHVSIPVLKQQQDTGESPGEQSINSEALWRRFSESWHVGAGQERYDRKESDPHRFRTSQGIDVWNEWEISLLPATFQAYANANTNIKMAVAGSRLYYLAGTSIKYSTDLEAAANDITGEPATAGSSIASNGYRVWTAHGADGVYLTDRTITTTASHITGSVSLLAYVKNRVMAAFGASIYDITALAIGAAGALPAALFTHGNTDWSWVGFAESQGHIYAAGFSGDKSLIYSIAITPEGTSLAAPTVAAALPDGEIVASVCGYLGRFLAIGSNKGFRLGVVSEGGGIILGALITTPGTVLCFEGQEEFIWYGLTNFSGADTGLGKFSTSQFSDVDKLVPSYASDLMAAAQTAAVLDVVTFENRRVFSVSGVGIYAEHATNLVSTGYLDSGGISYGMTDPKTALYVDTQVVGAAGSNSTIEIYFSTDGSAFLPLSEHTLETSQTVQIGEKTGNEFEIRIVLNRDSVNNAIGLSLLSWLLRVQPRPLVTNMIYATIFLAPTVTTLTDVPQEYDTVAELDYIEGLNLSKEIVSFQQLGRSYSVVLEDYEMNVQYLVDDTDGQQGLNSSCTLKLKRV